MCDVILQYHTVCVIWIPYDTYSMCHMDTVSYGIHVISQYVICYPRNIAISYSMCHMVCVPVCVTWVYHICDLRHEYIIFVYHMWNALSLFCKRDLWIYHICIYDTNLSYLYITCEMHHRNSIQYVSIVYVIQNMCYTICAPRVCIERYVREYVWHTSM